MLPPYEARTLCTAGIFLRLIFAMILTDAQGSWQAHYRPSAHCRGTLLKCSVPCNGVQRRQPSGPEHHWILTSW